MLHLLVCMLGTDKNAFVSCTCLYLCRSMHVFKYLPNVTGQLTTSTVGADLWFYRLIILYFVKLKMLYISTMENKCTYKLKYRIFFYLFYYCLHVTIGLAWKSFHF